MKRFDAYLASIPEDLLEQVTYDCEWLSREFAADPPGEGYRRRLERCREELACRGRARAA